MTDPSPGRLPFGSKCVAASQQACAQVGLQYGTRYACVSCHSIFGKWSGYQKHVGGPPPSVAPGGSTGAPARSMDAQGKAARIDAQDKACQAKAVKRACAADDVHALLTNPALPAVLDGRADLAGRAAATLVRHGRLTEATSLLCLPGVGLDAAGLRDALLLVPQVP